MVFLKFYSAQPQYYRILRAGFLQPKPDSLAASLFKAFFLCELNVFCRVGWNPVRAKLPKLHQVAIIVGQIQFSPNRWPLFLQSSCEAAC